MRGFIEDYSLPIMIVGVGGVISGVIAAVVAVLVLTVLERCT